MIFYYLAKYIYSFDRALSTVKKTVLNIFLSILRFYYLRGLHMKYPGGKKQHFEHLLFFTFHQGQKAAVVARDICMIYGEGVIGESTARKWFAKFKNDNFDINNTPCSGRTSEFDKDHLKALLKQESHQTSRELARKINCDQKVILNHLHSMGFAEKLGVWMPHELSENNKENCLQIASQHFTQHRATHGHKQCFLY